VIAVLKKVARDQGNNSFGLMHPERGRRGSVRQGARAD